MPFTRTKRKFWLKFIAVFLLFTLLNQILLPTVAWALTSGPTAPEATSFEPVDTTDMVNPLTGDFTYNLPLVEVPGPEGGYPLSLSYHAGIQPNEDASWVGLGWTLNPGAIARNVNGYADDFKDVSQNKRDFWEGGERSTFGISIGLPLCFTFGLSISNDTYQGHGIIGSSMGMGIPLGPVTLGVNSGSDGLGNYYDNIALSVSAGKSVMEGLQISGSLGISADMGSGQISGDVSGGIIGSGGFSLLGASMSSSSGKLNLAVGGGSSDVYNANAGKIQTESSGWSFGFPVGGGASLGISKKYIRYWSDESVNVQTDGALYMPTNPGNTSDFTNYATDVYRIHPKDSYFIYHPNADELQGGTFPSFDDYSVTAQGLSGTIRPYIYQGVLYSQNTKGTKLHGGQLFTDKTASIANSYNNQKVQYRFVNDFSNSYRQDPVNITPGSPNYSTNPSSWNPAVMTFDTPDYGNNDGNTGYNISENHLAGSKHVAWFTNEEINNQVAKSKGFVNTEAAGFTRMGNLGSLQNSKGAKQIGGYTITNQSGVNYHYALPAYSYNEYSRTETVNSPTGYKFTSSTKNEPYAYTWYLTAVTGPDYVDRNNNGLADDGDWGYWVTMDYGKWAGNYGWRNPSEGFHEDIENGFQSFSSGKKEVYYLDAVKTRTHTALFVKSIRADAKGTSENNFRPGWKNYPTASLKLDNIILYDNAELNTSINALRSSSTNYVHNIPDGNGGYTRVHYGENNIDVFDVSPALTSKCLRKIALTLDYSLCPGVPNSYDPEGSNTYIETPNANSPLLGKLTLLSIEVLGKGGVHIVPPMEFSYDFDSTRPENHDYVNLNSFATGNKGIITVDKGDFNIGDILRFSIANKFYYCTLIAKRTNEYDVLYLNGQPSVLSSHISVVRTKNPPYNKDAYDIWGMYKSDYIPSTNQTLSRLTNKVSNNGTDAWSLKSITSSLGATININYEGDTYYKSVLNNRSIIAQSITKIDYDRYEFTLNTEGMIDPQELFQVNDVFNFLLYATNSSGAETIFDTRQITQNNLKSRVESVTGNKIRIRMHDPNYAEDMKWRPVLRVANVFMKDNYNHYGGGTRVKSIEIDNLDGNKRRTNYSYEYNSSLSGVTSFEPLGLDLDNMQPYSATTRDNYRFRLYLEINSLLKVSREIPKPCVMYEYVTINDEVEKPDGSKLTVEGKKTYQYRVFNRNMVGVVEYQRQTSNIHTGTAKYGNVNLSIKDFTSQVGNLLRVISYDNKGNKLSETINHYLNDDIAEKSFQTQTSEYENRLLKYNYQGLIKERYVDSRDAYFITYTNCPQCPVYRYDVNTFSGRDVYPIIQTGTTSINYKDGIKTQQENLAFDFYNGMVSKTVTKDSYGNRFLSVSKSAYQEYPSLGLKVSSPSNKHMLTQQASNTVFKVNSSNTPLGVVSASVQTWSNDIAVIDDNGVDATQHQSGIWRMKAQYNWLPSGVSADNLTTYSSFADFNFAASSSNSNSWKKTNEITKYNVYSSPLESADINSVYSATRMGYKNTKVIIAGGPARYDEIAYAGVEDALLSNGKLSSNISLGAGSINNSTGHTGNKSLLIEPGQNGFIYQINDPVKRDYIASVWVKANDSDVTQARLYYQINGQTETPTPTFQKVAAGWYLLEMKIPASVISSGSTLTVGCKTIGGSNGIFFDDFRFQPLTAGTQAYVYNQAGELSHILNNNNLYTKFVYDAGGRLIETYKEVLGKTKIPLIAKTKYNYALGSKANKMQYGIFSKDCGVGFKGSNVIYQVPAGAYFAETQTGADALAFNDIQANGQNYANASPTAICQQLIYARAEISVPTVYTYNDQYGNYYSSTSAGIYIRFYSDAACTIALNLSAPLDVTFLMDESGTENYTPWSTSTEYTYTADQGVYELYLGVYILDYYDSYYDQDLDMNFDTTYHSLFQVKEINSGNYEALPTKEY